MKTMKFNTFLSLWLFLLFVGCGGDTIKSAEDLEEVKVDESGKIKNIENNIVGYWFSENPENPEYEFFASAFDVDFEPSVKQGRIFEGGKQVSSFYWQLQNDGTIELSIVDTLCNARPLNFCQSIGKVKITATGSSLSNAVWNIRYEDSNGLNRKNIKNRYSKKYVNFSDSTDGGFVFSKREVFDFPIAGEIKDNKISLWVDWSTRDFSKRIKLSANFNREGKDDIVFQTGENVSFYENRRFLVDGIGYLDLPVKSWYENVILSASNDDRYSLRYELHRKIELPEGLNIASVHLDGYRLLIKGSDSYEFIQQFIQGPVVKSTDRFFSFLDADIGDPIRTFGGAGNELVFISNEQVEVRLTDNVDGARTNTGSRSYTWNQNVDGSLFLDSPESKIEVKFIKAIPGGYNVLFKYSYGGYSRHDLILDAAPVVNESTFPGRYMFLSNDGYTIVEVIFHKDKTVTSNPPIVNGHWFQDTNGDIISFECTTLERRDVTSYSECYDDFNRLNDMAFVHIRRLGFIHKDGDNYKIKYSASFYGDVFDTTALSDDYLSLAWTYRWVRIGDE